MAEKNKKQKVNYSPEKKKKKKDPMIIAVCVFGAVLLISLPVVGKILSDSNNNLVIENESSEQMQTTVTFNSNVRLSLVIYQDTRN